MDQFLNLRVFTRLVDSGSFARTATQLGLAPATATTHVAQLEAHLGVRLINRNTRKLSVTDEGRALYERATHILNELQDIEDQFAGAEAGVQGRLRVSVPPLTASQILIPALPEFLQRYPQIQLEIYTDMRFVDLVKDGVDCAIRIGTLPDSSLISRSLGFCSMATCASPEYLKQHGEPRVPEDLDRHTCITTFSTTTGRARDLVFEKNGQKKIVEGLGPLIFNSLEASVQASSMGLGIAQCIQLATRELVEQRKLQHILTDWTPRRQPIQVVYPRSRLITARVRAFIDFALEIFPPHLVLDQTPVWRGTKLTNRLKKKTHTPQGTGRSATPPHEELSRKSSAP